MTLSKLDAVIRECHTRRAKDYATLCHAIATVYRGEMWRQGGHESFQAWGKAVHGFARTMLYEHVSGAELVKTALDKGTRVPTSVYEARKITGRNRERRGPAHGASAPARPTKVAGAAEIADGAPTSVRPQSPLQRLSRAGVVATVDLLWKCYCGETLRAIWHEMTRRFEKEAA